MLQPRHTDARTQTSSGEVTQVSRSQRARASHWLCPGAGWCSLQPGLSHSPYFCGLQPMTRRGEMEKGWQVHFEEVLSQAVGHPQWSRNRVGSKRSVGIVSLGVHSQPHSPHCRPGSANSVFKLGSHYPGPRELQHPTTGLC